MRDVKSAADCINNGGVVLLPTDTVYGLAVSPNHEEAIDKLFQLKTRPKSRFLPIMVGTEKDLEALGVHINNNVQTLLDSDIVPGAVTIVLGFVDKPLVDWLEGREEIAVRIPDDERILNIIKQTGPLLVTSANKHGNSTPDNVEDILKDLSSAPDLVIDGGITKEVPSTIVNCRVTPPKIERQGVVPKQVIFEILKNG